MSRRSKFTAVPATLKEAFDAGLFDAPTRTKYNAKPTWVDGTRFDSEREAARYLTLKAEVSYGVISDLELHPPYRLVVNGVLIATYIADFRYARGGRTVVEDVKGVKTPSYRMKKNLMRALFDIEILET